MSVLSTAFQRNAFQNNAFQIAPVGPLGSGDWLYWLAQDWERERKRRRKQRQPDPAVTPEREPVSMTSLAAMVAAPPAAPRAALGLRAFMPDTELDEFRELLEMMAASEC